MLEGFTWLQIAIAVPIVFGAYFVRGMSGFGAGLIGVPLMAFVLPLHVVVPVMSLVVFILFMFLTLRDWRDVVMPELKLLLPPTIVGVVLGLVLFKYLDNQVLIKLLAVFLVGYAVYALVVHYFGLPELHCSQRWAWPAALGGSFIDTLFGGGGGTLVVIYIHARQVGRAQFRATVAALWFVEMIARVFGYAVSGYYTREALLFCALMLPALWAGTYVGERLGNRISQEAFSKVVAVLLLLTGVSLLWK